jgi:hypothetical protein
MIVKPFGFLKTGAQSLLLDDYPGAEFAISTRLLSSTYTGDCMRVRRSSDGNNLDVGFVDGYLDQTAIETFRGASTEIQVVEWYDQSGNGMILSNGAHPDMPRLYTGGAYQTSLGKYAASFIDQWLTNSNYSPSMLNDSSWYIVNTPTSDPSTQDGCMVQAQELDGANYRVDVMGFRDGGYFTRLTQNGANNALNGFDTTSTAGNIISNIIDTSATSNVFEYNNSGKTDSNNGRSNTGTGADVTIGRSGNVSTGLSAEFLLNEMIYYDSDQTSTNAGIVSNINDFYSAF